MAPVLGCKCVKYFFFFVNISTTHTISIRVRFSVFKCILLFLALSSSSTSSSSCPFWSLRWFLFSRRNVLTSSILARLNGSLTAHSRNRVRAYALKPNAYVCLCKQETLFLSMSVRGRDHTRTSHQRKTQKSDRWLDLPFPPGIAINRPWWRSNIARWTIVFHCRWISINIADRKAKKKKTVKELQLSIARSVEQIRTQYAH